MESASWRTGIGVRVGAAGADPRFQGRFRQAQQLDDREPALLD
jgi:hypothetical protein